MLQVIRLLNCLCFCSIHWIFRYYVIENRNLLLIKMKGKNETHNKLNESNMSGTIYFKILEHLYFVNLG